MKSNQEFVEYNGNVVLVTKLDSENWLVGSGSGGTKNMNGKMELCFLCRDDTAPLNWSFLVGEDEMIKTSLNICLLCQAILK